jgi:hypothetical protein
MRILDVVIYTDKVGEVRTFYEKHFRMVAVEANDLTTFAFQPIGEARITYIDAASAGVIPSKDIVLRWCMPHLELERDRLVSGGVACGELVIEDWGAFYGKQVRCFSMIDPAGAKIHFFEDRYGETVQLITLGDGRNTREVQR